MSPVDEKLHQDSTGATQYKHTEQSLKIILEWANNKFQRYNKLSTPIDEKKTV